jgi:hypothetical protein
MAVFLTEIEFLEEWINQVLDVLGKADSLAIELVGRGVF